METNSVTYSICQLLFDPGLDCELQTARGKETQLMEASTANPKQPVLNNLRVQKQFKCLIVKKLLQFQQQIPFEGRLED